MALVNALFMSNKSFTLNELNLVDAMDFMFLVETWQRGKKFFRLKALILCYLDV